MLHQNCVKLKRLEMFSETENILLGFQCDCEIVFCLLFVKHPVCQYVVVCPFVVHLFLVRVALFKLHIAFGQQPQNQMAFQVGTTMKKTLNT